MLLPLLFLFLTSVVQSGPVLKSCTIGDSILALGVCTPMAESLKSTISKHKVIIPNLEQFKNISAQCQKTVDCLGVLNCKQAEEARVIFESACGGLELLAGDVKTCWPKFYTAVHDKKYECTGKFDFVNADLSKQKSALEIGKSCVLEVTQKECSKTFNDYIKNANSYEKFVNILTTRPDDAKCEGIHFKLQVMQCAPVLEQFKVHSMAFASEAKKLKDGGAFNASIITAAHEACKVSKKCVEDHCDTDQAKHVAKLSDTCNVINQIGESSGFLQCLEKMKKDDAIKGKKKCFEPDASGKMDCSKMQTEKTCILNRMTEVCGPEVDGAYEKGLVFMEKQCRARNQ